MATLHSSMVTLGGAAVLLAVALAPAPARAADFTVNGTSDAHDVNPGNGVCSAGRPHGCTLRAAIEEANANALVDTIQVHTPGTYQLELGQLAITQSVNIYGATGVFVDGGGDSRVMHVQNGDVTIVDLTLTGGFLDAGEGAGLLVEAEANVHLKGCVVTRNYANEPGAGVANLGFLHVDRSSVRENQNAQFSAGYVMEGTGGGICNRSEAVLLIEKSTIANNLAFAGAGLWNVGGDVTILDSTISGNLAGGIGAGIYTESVDGAGYMLIERSTITDNEIHFPDTWEIIGGAGLAMVSTEVDIRSSILAGNVQELGNGPTFVYAPDCSDFDDFVPGSDVSSEGYNLIGTLEGCECYDPSIDDILPPDDLTPVDPLLGPLAPWTAGGTALHIPMVGSPAILAGPDCWLLPDTPLPECHDLDQRGYSRYTVGGTDIGAYETNGTPPPRF